MAEAAAKPTRKSENSEVSDFEKLYTKALKFVNDALKEDEGGFLREAIDLYKTSLIFIEKALSINIGSTLSNKRKLEATKVNVLERLKNLQGRLTEENRHQNQENELLEIMELDGIQHATDDENCNATELLTINDTQVFFIQSDGLISAPSYPSKLGIYKFRNDQDKIATGAPAFLKVGSWTYPLVPNESPSLQSVWGAYMFPDLEKGAGNVIGVILPDNTSVQDRESFEALIREYSMLSVEEGEEVVEELDEDSGKLEKKRGSERITEGIDKSKKITHVSGS